MAISFLVVGVGLLVAAARSPRRVLSTRGITVIGAVAVVGAAGLIWFVRSDDPNVAGNQPRWDFYQGGATHPLFWISIALEAAAVVLAASTLLRRSSVLAYGVVLAAAAGLGAGALSIFGFSLT